MSSEKKKKKPARPIFDAIRKPVAPPSRKIGTSQSAEKLLPSGRKSKHKKKEDISE